ncbi:caspase-14 [Esox lucius]|uniref:Caspase family p20 domain-containing protein n=1 Tax=Esox lucius TaxID=8010 RepID=A0A3P8ZWA7_ESOLU|nr:caspase-14 [Esox lucius]
MDSYNITKDQRALLLCDLERGGVKHDIRRLETVFKKCRFHVTRVNVSTKTNVMTDLKTFQNKLSSGVSGLAVVIVAHGRLGHITVSDGELKLEEIFQLFSNRACPALQQKPKLFVVQSCRGVFEHAQHPSIDGGGQGQPGRTTLLPTESDVMVVYAVHPGMLAVRHADSGCPLFEEMEKVFEDLGTSHHMYELFTEVNERLMLNVRRESYGISFDKKATHEETRKIMECDIGRSLHIESSLTKKWYLTEKESFFKIIYEYIIEWLIKSLKCMVHELLRFFFCC